MQRSCCGETIQPASRVQHAESQDRATVAFVGSVQSPDGKSEEWIGVIWDDESRGKHDGVANGVRYFQGPSPTSASFLRPEKIMQTLSFEAAVSLKYSSEEATNAVEKMDFREKKRGQAAVVAVLVGKEKADQFFSRLDTLSIITVANMGVHCTQDVGWIRENISKCEDLDLGENMFWNLEAAAVICAQLPNLKSLRLSGNRFSSMEVTTPNPFQHLAELVFNESRVSWQDMQGLSGALPNLERLHLGSNGISDLHTTPPIQGDSWPRLSFLNLECNLIQSWEAVVPLSALPCLRQLVLNDNKLETLEGGECFAELHQLLLGNNLLRDWSSIHKLNTFPKLCDVRLTGNPLFEGVGIAASRQTIIAKLGRIVVLNSSQVRQRERDDNEKLYIARVVYDSGGIESVNKAEHPRFDELIEKWGPPILQAGGAADSGGGGCMIVVTIRSNAAASMSKAPVERKLPPSTTIGALKRICQQLFKIDATKQKIFCRREQSDVIPDFLNEDMKTFSYYGVSSGCEIIVEENDEKQTAQK